MNDECFILAFMNVCRLHMFIICVNDFNKCWHYTTYTWNIFLITHTIRKQSISNLPSEYRGTFSFILCHVSANVICCNTWFTSTNRTWSDGTSFVITSKNFTDTSVRYLQDSRNVTRSSTTMSEFYNPLPGWIGKRASVHKHTA